MVISSYDYVLYYELRRSNNTVCPADTHMDMFDACIIRIHNIQPCNALCSEIHEKLILFIVVPKFITDHMSLVIPVDCILGVTWCLQCVPSLPGVSLVALGMLLVSLNTLCLALPQGT